MIKYSNWWKKLLISLEDDDNDKNWNWVAKRKMYFGKLLSIRIKSII